MTKCETVFRFALPYLTEEDRQRVRTALDQYEPEDAMHLTCAILAQADIPVPRPYYEMIVEVGRRVNLHPDAIAALRVSEQ